MNSHIICTGLYGDTTFKFLSKACSAISKDSRFQKIAQRTLSDANSHVELAPDGEVIINIFDGWRTVFYRKDYNNAKCLDWLGIQLKELCYKLMDDEVPYLAQTSTMRPAHVKWSRSNEYDDIGKLIDPEFTLSVAEAYFIYDFFRGRQRLERRYSPAVIAKMSGQKRDPLTTEAERARREEVARLEAECKQKVDECNWEGYRYNYYSHTQPAFVEMREAYVKLEEEFKMKARQLEETLGAKWKKRAIDIRKEYADKIADVNASVDALAMFA